MKKVLVVMGGISSEREISLATGEAFFKAVQELGYAADKYDFQDLTGFVKYIDLNRPDVIVNAMHGKYLEDGNFQGVLNLLRIPYTHSGLLASAIGMNKPLAKLMVSEIGVNVSPGKVVCIQEIKACGIKMPFVIKPINDGSSVNVHIVFNDGDLNKSVKDFDENEQVLVEQYIKGRECVVSVLHGKALAVTEIIPKELFYDYDAKYNPKKAAVHKIPADFPEAVYKEALETSEKIYYFLGTRGAMRVDYIYDESSSKLYFLEINTQPGMTNMSLIPEQAKYLGITFNELVERIISDAKYD